VGRGRRRGGGGGRLLGRRLRGWGMGGGREWGIWLRELFYCCFMLGSMLLFLLDEAKHVLDEALWVLLRQIMPASLHNSSLKILVQLARHSRCPCCREYELPAHDHRSDVNLSNPLPPFPILSCILFKHPVHCKRRIQSPCSRVLGGVEFEVFTSERGLILRQAVEEMLEVGLLFAGDQRHRDIGLSLEVEMPNRRGMFNIIVVSCTRQWAFSPIDACNMVWKLRNIGMSDHPTNIMPHNVDLFLYPHMIMNQLVEISSEHSFRVSGRWFGRVSCTAVIRC